MIQMWANNDNFVFQIVRLSLNEIVENFLLILVYLQVPTQLS